MALGLVDSEAEFDEWVRPEEDARSTKTLNSQFLILNLEFHPSSPKTIWAGGGNSKLKIEN